MTFWDTIAEDLRAARVVPAGPLSRSALLYRLLWCSFFKPPVVCVFWYRVNRRLFENRRFLLASLLSARRRYWFANDISYKARIGAGLYIPHLSDIVIGPKVEIGSRATILNGVTVGTVPFVRDKKQRPVVGDHVFIGTGAKVLGGIRIGDHVTISALSLCTRDVPSQSIFFGIPPNHKIWTEQSEEK